MGRLGCAIGGAAFLILAVALGAGVAQAHAVLVESAPAANSTVTGPDVSIRLRFNVRIEAKRSGISLILADKSTQAVEMVPADSPDTLTAVAKGLKPGAYKISWRVLATDGHITRGEVPFTVKGA